MDHLPSAVTFDHHRIAMMISSFDFGNYYLPQVQSRNLDDSCWIQLQQPLINNFLSKNTDGHNYWAAAISMVAHWPCWVLDLRHLLGSEGSC